LLEIGDIPFSTARQKPTREEALEYYRKVAEHYHLDVRQYQWVKTVTGSDNNFQITATDSLGRIYDYRTRKLIVSTGYYDLSNPLNIPGEDLSKVFHYYREPHPFFDMDVVVIGGKNSAAISALDLWRHGARVTLVHRGSKLHNHVKYWILPDIENRIKNREIAAYFGSTVGEIGADYVNLYTPEGPVQVKNDFVFAMTGYHPDIGFLEAHGIRFDHAFGSSFTVWSGVEVIGEVTLRVPGMHNVYNSLAAIAVGLELQVNFDQIAKALGEFTGADRRFGEKHRAGQLDAAADQCSARKQRLPPARQHCGNRDQPDRRSRRPRRQDQERSRHDQTRDSRITAKPATVASKRQRHG